MSRRTDLTRWNRAGLTRFRYVDGNAVTYLEELRRALAERFAGRWPAVEAEAAGSETHGERLARLRHQYDRERGDWGWEIARALARACHVLTEHLDAYANEGYLATATQWDNVRRLVATLDYRPAPPASAVTRLVLEAEGQGTVERGFQVRHTPPEGGPPVIFETLESLEVDPALDGLRLAGWNRSVTALGGAAAAASPWTAAPGSGISAGQVGVVVREDVPSAAAAVVVDEVDSASGGLTLKSAAAEPAWPSWPRGQATLLVGPRFVRRPRLNGPDVVAFAEPHGLAAGDVAAWRESGGWRFARVREGDDRAVCLEDAAGPPPDAEVFRALAVARGDRGLLLPDGYRAAARPSSEGYVPLTSDDVHVEKSAAGSYQRLLDDTVAEVFVVPAATAAAGRTATVAPAEPFVFDGKPGGLASGQWTVADDGERLRPLRLATVEEREDGFLLSFATAAPDRVVRLYGRFEHLLRPRGWGRNDTPLAGGPLVLEAAVPGLLVPGRTVLVERESAKGFRDARPGEVRRVEPGSRTVELALSPPLAAEDGFTLGNTVVRGNVALAGHGEARPEKILGSGEATRSRQRFVLAEEGVSFVADPTQPSGVRADVDVRVAGRTWEQVASLRESKPADAHYTVHMTEEGHLAIEFGDGRHGRRLPTGAGNVRAGYRLGSGLAGNLAAGSLQEAVRPHRLVASVRQPLAATGGNDMESTRSLRENAPASVLALERAVSAADFANLAVRQSNVWQARAFSRPTGLGREVSVEVVAVPAGGGTLGALAKTLADSLRAHALPGVEVRVSDAARLAFDLEVTVRVKSAEHDPAAVVREVRRALLAAFSLERRRLGQELFLAEVYQVVEGVAGVESSRCVVDGDAALRRREAADSEVYYLDPAASEISLRSEEWTL